MKLLETHHLDVKVLDDGMVQARRKDRQPLTAEDKEEAVRVADSSPGVCERDILRIFSGGKVVARLNR